jgi:hypothetical protein
MAFDYYRLKRCGNNMNGTEIEPIRTEEEAGSVQIDVSMA